MYHGARTVGFGRRQYVRAVALAEKTGNFAAAKLLRNSRDWTAVDDETTRHPGLLGDGRLWVDETVDYEDEGHDEVSDQDSDSSERWEGLYECNSGSTESDPEGSEVSERSEGSEGSDDSDGIGDRDHGSGGTGCGDDGEKKDSGEVDTEAVSPMTQLFVGY
jgi:hypothetical protein